MGNQESAVCQTKAEGEWVDFARTTNDRAAAWVAGNPDERRAVHYVSGAIIT